MFKLTKRNETPPGMFRYLVPETNKWLPDPKTHGAPSLYTLEDLLDVIRQHYVGNNLTVPGNLRELVEDQVCRSLEPKWCCDEHGRKPRAKGLTSFGWKNVIHGTRVLSKFLASGRVRVSNEEAAARASLCKRCHFHRSAEECKSCGGETVTGVAKAIVGGQTMPFDEGLKACAVCGCGLIAAVRVPLELLNETVSEEEAAMWPEFCWRRG